jgi:hypothetical protein
MDVLFYIKKLVIHGRTRFTEKARIEMDRDDLEPSDVVESIVNAQTLAKVVRSKSRRRHSIKERLYVIKSFNFTGTLIYTKGAIRRETAGEAFYILVSSKIATAD